MIDTWTEESLAQAIAEEGLAFVVRELNTAKELLEALTEQVAFFDGERPKELVASVMLRARAAIAKAGG